MTEDNEKLLKGFFNEASLTEIPDGRFSDSVMRRIDKLSDRRTVIMSRLWTAIYTVAGIIIVWMSGLLSEIPKVGENGLRLLGNDIMTHMTALARQLLALDISHIPYETFIIPTAITFGIALAALKNESNNTSLI